MYKLPDVSTCLLVPHADGRAGGDSGSERRRLAHLGPHDGDICKAKLKGKLGTQPRPSIYRGGQLDSPLLNETKRRSGSWERSE